MPVMGKYGSGPVGEAPINSTISALPSGYSYWTYVSAGGGTPQRMQVNFASMGTPSYANVYTINSNRTTPFTYSTNKSYQIITNTVNLYGTAASFSVSTTWNDRLNYSGGMTAGVGILNATQSFYHYTTPTTTIINNVNAIWSANGTFSGNRGITDFKINELDFSILGFSYYRRPGHDPSGNPLELSATTSNSLGWYYNIQQDKYFWYDYVSGSPSTITAANNQGYFPVGGPNGSKVSRIGYRLNNALYKFISYSSFNLSFNYQNTGNFPLRIYTSNAPLLSEPTWSQLASGVYTPPGNALLLATITQSNYVTNPGQPSAVTYSSVSSAIPINFYGVTGNKYLLFVGGFAGLTSSNPTHSAIYISNITIEGGYHLSNNRQFVMNNFTTYSTINSLSGATYSALVATGNTINATASLVNPGISRIYSKLGNGRFRAGIWENGVWNSGWRVDENMYEFTDIKLYFNYKFSKRWRVQVMGPTASVAQFNISDNVAISNIVAVDINEERKLIKGYYTIINKTEDSIIVEFDNNFPIRRIVKDSDYHRINVTKNVWLSGGFLNGYFKGIWNYGLFKGYPLITEMYNTHWIDGIFDGGHFYSEQYTVGTFSDTVYQNVSSINLPATSASIEFIPGGKVGLTFSSPHGLSVGDVITIDKTNKNLNPQYDGDTTVIQVVNPYLIVTNKDWGQDSNNETGLVTIEKNKGLIQKIDFKANNISKITSETSLESNAVFVYNSWMDVVFDEDSASSIGRPQTMVNSVSKKTYSENNLYGYVTNDILESTSTFRDSYSLQKRIYRLGTKYKIFADYIGDAGTFEDDFGNSIVSPNPVGSIGTYVTVYQPPNLFLDQGWTYSSAYASSITFSRAAQDIDTSTNGDELKVQAFSNGGILDIVPVPVNDVNNRTNEQIQKLRYTKVEFDLITYSAILGETYTALPSLHPAYYFKYSGLKSTLLYSPHIHFNNLNYTLRTFTTGGVKSSVLQYATYLPIFNNVNHLMTRNKRKVEYFYNKRNLGMHFHGFNQFDARSVDYFIDNLHFYEVDMIPFFQYFTEDNINKGVVIPFQGVSPFIDYTNANFNFIDNIAIGLDSIQTQNSNVPVSGVGAGIGTGVVSGGIYVQISANTGFAGKTAEVVGSGSFSDLRLKENVIKVGISSFGINIYEWNYKGNKERFRGVVAQELVNTKFNKSLSIKQGYYWVDYSDLDVKFEKV